MEEHANEGKKSPLDDIINHMTADWHTYGLPPGGGGGPAQAPAPHSSHVWTNWHAQGQTAASNTGQVPGQGTGPTRQPQPYFMMGGGEPTLPVFFQADQPPPGYPVDPQAGKAQDFFSPTLQTTAQQSDGNDLGGTMVDIGGGNFVKVRYSGGHGGTVNPQYLPVNAGSTVTNVLPPSLDNILPLSNQSDSSRQHAPLANNYGLFRELQPQQLQSMMRPTHLQHRTAENESPQHQSRTGLQHGPPGLLQPSQTLFNEHLQNQQFQQHIFSVTQPQQYQHELMQRVQRQHLEQQQQQARQQLQEQQQQCLNPSQQDGAPNLASKTSQNQDQLIQNLVGNWTVPNQTGRYNPFGLALNESNDSTHENVKEVEPVKKNDKSVRRTRIIAEVHPMRPSYSAVLTTPSPAPSPLKPNMPVSPSNGHGQNNNSSALITNSVNKINSDASRPKSTSSGSSGKAKNSSKSNGVVSQGGKLKRQHSNGNEETNNLGIKTGHAATTPKSSGLSSSSSADLDESNLGNSSPSSLSRRWVSLDDLENEENNPDTAQVFEEEENPSDISLKEGNASDKKSEKSSTRSGARSGVKQSSSSVSDEGFLNNHKPSSGTAGTKSGSTIGTNSTKRPIHINNNLGTNHGSHWAGQQTASQSSNSSKGDKPVRSSKSGRTGSDERKGAKNDGKTSSGGSSSSGMSGRSGRGSMSSMADKAAVLQGKRNQRGSRRKDGVAAATLVFRKYGQLALTAIIWFFHLLSDVVGMSLRLSLHLCLVFWENWVISTATWLQNCFWRIPQLLPERILHSRVWRFICKCFGKSDPGEQSRNSSKKSGRGVEGRDSVIPGGLSHNISMPSTGEEAMKRLLACKGKDPYSILGVTPTCSDDDVKKYYKRQAFLVHPDKNNQPGAEEAFKILVHAFELIGEPEKRAEYDRYVAETQQVEQAWSELSDLLSQLHQKMEYAANTIRCTNCGKRHKRIAVPRKPFAARFCAQCKIKHSAKEGDIWAETMVMGFLWHYYACMEGAVYDITDWASCQTNNLRHLKPNSHTVQYRIVLGRQRQQNPRTPSEPDLENFLSSLYNQAGGASKGAPGPSESSASSNVPSRQETARNRNKKGKRNK
ncbi:homeotic protein female sterile [Frankliniella occidentalis]|uniref:Homeotic protein female sterile n=1 Tax=Frankliniella occidentalis TaxID=133901 RepID=A0A6J1TB71_FRAOC|nr:homeotic protein female sterile [Frankliniella occidentalis]